MCVELDNCQESFVASFLAIIIIIIIIFIIIIIIISVVLPVVVRRWLAQLVQWLSYVSDDKGFDSSERLEFCLYLILSRSATWTTQSTFQWMEPYLYFPICLHSIHRDNFYLLSFNFTEAIPLCVNIFTTGTKILKYAIVSAIKLKVRGYIFRSRCSHLQANLHRSSAFNVRTIWDPIMCTIMIYVWYKPMLKRIVVDKLDCSLI